MADMERRPPRNKRHKSRPAEEAFDFLVTLANRKDLSYMLEVCAGISAIAGLADPATEPLATRFHYQISRIVLDAVLRSNASTESFKRLQPEDLPKLVNNAIDATNNTDAVRCMTRVNRTSLARLEMIRFLAQLGQVQIAPFEDHPSLVAGRTVGLFSVVLTTHRSEIERRVAGATKVLDLLDMAPLGLSIRDAAVVYLLLLRHYASLWKEFDQSLPMNEERLTAALRGLDHLALHNHWSFTTQSVASDLLGVTRQIGRFLELFARTPEELRSLSRPADSPYQIGHVSCRMLPLDRFPMVALPNERYIVPSVTILRKAFPHVVDFSLMDACRRENLDDLYNQVRGAALELYIEDLVSDRLPSCVLVPEMEYRSPLGAKRSPDLTILDSDDQSLIAIEAKAKRLSPAAAADATDTELDRTYGSSVEALRRLPAKIEDLYSAPEFKRWQDQLDSIPLDRAILVSVVPTTLFSHDELEPLRARLDNSHPLADLNLPFCFLDLFVFERAVELARKHRIPLGQLLREHFEDSRAGDPNTSSARLFRGRERPEPSEMFAWHFI